MDKAAPDPLQVIRDRIDVIDAELHRLLIERSGVIAELIRAKGAGTPGSAFRPDREADMMRRLAARHEGDLPLTTVEHIWREIISTFTAMQAPFRIAAGPAPDQLAMRDLIRFYFGFAIPVANFPTAEAAIERAAGSERDIAVVAAESEGRWWEALTAPHAPKIFAKLPFIEIPDRPAALPAYVIGPALEARLPSDIRVCGLKNTPQLTKRVGSLGGHVAACTGESALVELPVAVTPSDICSDGEGAQDLGGYFQPIRFLSRRTK
jgi:chorismate mutase